jgi:DNA alkylation damage repair protein AlkB
MSRNDYTGAECIRPGAFRLPGYLSCSEQKALVDFCLSLGKGETPFYQPVLRTGARMRLRMLCLGRHWNARTYKYEAWRSDVDGNPVGPLPRELADLARAVAGAVGMACDPDIVLINYYEGNGRLGMHQDKDEQPGTIAKGIPVVSISLGDSAEFLFGGIRRSDPSKKIVLESGDAFVFGGPSRLCYHGVRRILPGSGPENLSIEGRLNLTFRQF